MNAADILVVDTVTKLGPEAAGKVVIAASHGGVYAGYEAASGRRIDRDAVAYWEVMAHVRWAVIALQQAQRFLSGAEASLEAALTGHVVPGLEFELLHLIGGGD